RGGYGEEHSYEQQRRLIQHADPRVREDLASKPGTRPEVLYYLAGDKAAQVRRAIAGNPKTPAQADRLLATDTDDEVRCALARKIARLVPNLPPDEQVRYRELTIETLELLAQDQLPRVRAILAKELKHATSVPHRLIKRLAHDVEEI